MNVVENNNLKTISQYFSIFPLSSNSYRRSAVTSVNFERLRWLLQNCLFIYASVFVRSLFFPFLHEDTPYTVLHRSLTRLLHLPESFQFVLSLLSDCCVACFLILLHIPAFVGVGTILI